jgi:hypothetical protein
MLAYSQPLARPSARLSGATPSLYDTPAPGQTSTGVVGASLVGMLLGFFLGRMIRF